MPLWFPNYFKKILCFKGQFLLLSVAKKSSAATNARQKALLGKLEKTKKMPFSKII